MPKILLIEDDLRALEMLRFRFEKAGYEVSIAEDGDDGFLKALRQPDLIFLDVRIPKLDGWQVCKMLKSEPRTKHIPVVMLTGCSQPAQEQYGKALGADAYLTKPWDSKELMRLTRGFLQKKP